MRDYASKLKNHADNAEGQLVDAQDLERLLQPDAEMAAHHSRI